MLKQKLSPSQELNTKLRQQNDLDKKLVHSLNPKKIPNLKQLKHLPKVLSKKEKNTMAGLVLLMAAAVIFIGVAFYQKNFISTPTIGGEYTEGLIGALQYANPLLSQTNDVDSDIARLVFSGLLKYDKNLSLLPDIAERWEVNEDHTVYTFFLRNNVTWHDGEPLTADDVVFTIRSIQDPDFKSPLLVSLRGVSVQKVDDQTVTFTLPEAYPSFLEVMTFGILPEHIWGEIPPINANLTEYNLKPVGSGAWQFKSLTKDRLGNLKSYTLAPYPQYYGAKPYLEKITFKFYPDFQTGIQALQNNSVEGLSFLPKDLKKDLSSQKNLTLYSFSLPQYTAIFFNQKENESLKEKSVRKALAAAIDKSKILSEALQLEGEIIDGPIISNIFGLAITKKTDYNPEDANTLLDQAGWKRMSREEYVTYLEEQAAEKADTATSTAETEENNTATPVEDELLLEEHIPEEGQGQNFYRQQGNEILTVRLTTVDQSENIKAAELVKEFWQAVGVRVELEIVEGNKISREVIKPRGYQALLFGIIVGSNPDPYPFWHSSQALDPGLNLAQYANRNVDKLLEDARKTDDEETRNEAYQKFIDTLNEELPAIFLYNPTYTYVVDQKIKGIDIGRIIVPADRFNNLNEWYIKTKRTFRGANAQ